MTFQEEVSKVSIWKVVRALFILVFISVLYPPVAQDLLAFGTGDFVGFRFVFDIGAFLKIDWGILVFEWLLFVGVIWLLSSKSRLFSRIR